MSLLIEENYLLNYSAAIAQIRLAVNITIRFKFLNLKYVINIQIIKLMKRFNR